MPQGSPIPWLAKLVSIARRAKTYFRFKDLELSLGREVASSVMLSRARSRCPT